MGVRKAGGFVFVIYPGDHPPAHVHIFDARNREVGRWGIEHECPMKGDDFVVTKRLRKALYDAGCLRGEP